MIGICAVVYDNGLAVSNDCVFDADKYLVGEGENRRTKQVLTIKMNSVFDIQGMLIEGEKVECIFKSEEGKKNAFVGFIKSRGKQLTVIHELIKIDHYYNEILSKLKQCQTQKTSPVI